MKILDADDLPPDYVAGIDAMVKTQRLWVETALERPRLRLGPQEIIVGAELRVLIDRVATDDVGRLLLNGMNTACYLTTGKWPTLFMLGVVLAHEKYPAIERLSLTEFLGPGTFHVVSKGGEA